ncbi:MAG: hypothetical protein PHR83_06485 [Paludibacter sp.]|nr:hypothetical protein [Paludibacter sp.]
MEEKKFNCKAEDVPVLAGFALKSLETDWDKFEAYSPVFTSQFVAGVTAQQTDCYALTKSSEVLKLQKVVTLKIADKSNELRLSLNLIEGYLKLAVNDLDIRLSDFGLTRIRTAISKGNVEGLISDTRSFIAVVKRNEAVLLAKGMKPELIAALTSEIQDLEELNTHQNVKKNERSRLADDNLKVFNELWDSLGIILSAGRAIFRGVDEVKLREYTLANLLKRVHSENGSSDKTTTDVKPA